MSSQARQDDFVLSLIKEGFYLDVGCWNPEKDNNSYKLEQNGWSGLSMDIKDFSKEWESRKNAFILGNALECNWGIVLNSMPMVIDYLSLDIEGNGDRFKSLERIVAVREFKIITVEHDIYVAGNNSREAEPQRELLTSLGYDLVCKNVKKDTRPFEDWWVNPKYVQGYEHYRCDRMQCDSILNKKVVSL